MNIMVNQLLLQKNTKKFYQSFPFAFLISIELKIKQFFVFNIKTIQVYFFILKSKDIPIIHVLILPISQYLIKNHETLKPNLHQRIFMIQYILKFFYFHS